jgi:hypothetical protein
LGSPFIQEGLIWVRKGGKNSFLERQAEELQRKPCVCLERKPERKTKAL